MNFRRAYLMISLLVVPAMRATAGPAILDPAKAGPDYAIQGEYVGNVNTDTGPLKTGLQVVAIGHGEFEARRYQGGLPGDGWTRGDHVDAAKGSTADGVTTLKGEHWIATIKDSHATIAAASDPATALGTLDRTERKSPTLGAKPPAGAIVLFDGSNADAWNNGKLVDGKLLHWGTTSKQQFGNCILHVEFRCPFMPEDRGQGRGNSGVYLQNRYEIQVLDSFSLEGQNDDCGAIYKVALPKVNMSFPPLVWQTYDAEFTAARFDGFGQKNENARITVRHNGVLTIDNAEIPHTTTAAGNSTETTQPGPIYLQDHGNPVVFRNIWLVEKKE